MSNAVLGWLMIAGLILLEPVTMAYVWHVARKRGWL